MKTATIEVKLPEYPAPKDNQQEKHLQRLFDLQKMIEDNAPIKALFKVWDKESRTTTPDFIPWVAEKCAKLEQLFRALGEAKGFDMPRTILQESWHCSIPHAAKKVMGITPTNAKDCKDLRAFREKHGNTETAAQYLIEKPRLAKTA